MNLLFVADVSIANIVGGAERCLYEQSTRLSCRGHNVHVLTRRLPEHNKSHESIDGVNEWRYDCQLQNPLTFIKTTTINSKKLFEDLNDKYAFDYVIFHQPFSAIGINSSKRSKKLPKIYICHSLSFEEYMSRNKNTNINFQTILNRLQIIIRKKIEKYSLKKSDLILVLSKFTKDRLKNAYNISNGKVRIIPGGVDITTFHPFYDRIAIRKQLNIYQDKIILLTIRNLVERMGLENLVNAIKIAVKKAPDIYLLIGGDGPLKPHLTEMVDQLKLKENIKFTGFIREKQLAEYYGMADMFVLPTKELEGFGLVTLEAMASGLPVLGTPIGGTKEIIGNFDSDFLFEGTDPESIAKLISEKVDLIKRNPQKWKDISLRCRNFIETYYSWEKNIDSLEALFNSTSQN